MSRCAYTYLSPYRLSERIETIKVLENIPADPDSLLHFCPSQEMVQGFEQDAELKDYFVANQFLISALYPDWEENHTRLNQSFAVENVIDNKDKMKAVIKNALGSVSDGELGKIISSLKHNIANLTETFRLFSELSLDPSFDINDLNISIDQKLALEIYKMIVSEPNSVFRIKRENDIDSALKNAYIEKLTEREFRKSGNTKTKEEVRADFIKKNANLSFKRQPVIINALFRFTPLLISAIKAIEAAGHRIIFLFNYRPEPELAPFYQCWIDLYNNIVDDIHFDDGDKSFQTKNRNRAEKNVALAMALGNVSDGENVTDSDFEGIEFLEFENLSEFSGYVAQRFRAAIQARRADDNKRNNLSYMTEMFYSASRRANVMLKACFPEQFGASSILSYPLGKLFVTMADMWDRDKKVLVVSKISQLATCIRGFWNDPSDKIAILYHLEPYIEHCRTTDEVLDSLALLLDIDENSLRVLKDDYKKYPLNINNIPQEQYNNFKELIDCYNNGSLKCSLPRSELNNTVSRQQVFDLFLNMLLIRKSALNLFDGVPNGKKTKNDFYQIVKNFLNKYTSEESPDEIRISEGILNEAIKDALDTLNKETLFPETLKQMQQVFDFYFSDNQNGSSAKWIIHDLVQIDGDILVDSSAKIDGKSVSAQRINHFCFLSDEDLFCDPTGLLPWPLELSFFDSMYAKLREYSGTSDAQNAILLFSEAEKEYRNFPKYALIYGILFSQNPVILSYVKNVEENEEKQHTLFNLLRLLGIKTTQPRILPPKADNDYSGIEIKNTQSVTDIKSIELEDRILFSSCFYRFVLNKIVDGGTFYRSRFQLVNYLKNQIMVSLIKAYNDKNSSSINLDKMKKCQPEIDNMLDGISFLTAEEKYEIRNDCIRRIETDADYCNNNYSFLDETLKKKELQGTEYLSLWNNNDYNNTNDYEKKINGDYNDWIGKSKSDWLGLIYPRRDNNVNDPWHRRCDDCPLKIVCVNGLSKK